MSKLTKRMHEILEKADLEHSVINDVPMGTMYGLEARGLITSRWRTVGGPNPPIQCSGGRSFPWFDRVKLTAAGIRAARDIQGRRTDVGEASAEPASPPSGVWIRPRTRV